MARILMADDDQDMVEICRRLLPRSGHTLVVANNGADAVRLARSENPELILMDMRMPAAPDGDISDRAGLDAVVAIKASPEHISAPIIALTGHTMANFRAAIFEAGCVEIIAKPIEDFSRLIRTIDKVLRPPDPP